VTYPAGVEPTSNYLAYVRNYRGANPFPVDIIVDRGRCRPARRDMFRTINGIDGSFWPPSAGT
jgi:hypothetical protein